MKIGTTVQYRQSYLASTAGRLVKQHVGQIDRVIPSSPLLVYVRWDDGSYNAVTENVLESL